MGTGWWVSHGMVLPYGVPTVLLRFVHRKRNLRYGFNGIGAFFCCGLCSSACLTVLTSRYLARLLSKSNAQTV